MDKRSTVVKNLESWYTIDSILFNDHAKNVIKEGEMFKEYVSLKASLLSNLAECWAHIGYSPTTAVVSVKALQESAVVSAKRGKVLASNMLTKESVKKKMTNMIVQESKKKDVPANQFSNFSEKFITEKFYQIALDNALIGIPVIESASPDKINDFKGEVLEEAHRMMRSHLVRIALLSSK